MRTIHPMKPWIWMAVMALAGAGCSSTKTAIQSEVEFDIDRLARTGKLRVQSPKDLDLENVRVTKSGTNYTVSIGRCRAVVSSAAVSAAIADSQTSAQQWADAMELMKFLANKAAASQGVAQSDLPVRGQPIPSGPQSGADFQPPTSNWR